MSSHGAKIEWQRADAAFTDNQYSRTHLWRFDGGTVVPASSSPEVVKAPFSDPAKVDPEEAYIASLASCHMLWFLDLARASGYVIDRYVDEAIGHMVPRADGKLWIASVELRPVVDFSGMKRPDDAVLAHLHHRAHEECFLAKSVKSDISVAGKWRYREG
jgi:organic hydroperoxide reductase OsmC/OhrA